MFFSEKTEGMSIEAAGKMLGQLESEICRNACVFNQSPTPSIFRLGVICSIEFDPQTTFWFHSWI